MSLHRADIRRWGDLVRTVIASRALAGNIRSLATDCATNAALPEDQRHTGSPFRRLIDLTRYLADKDEDRLQIARDLAYAVGRELITNVAPDHADLIEPLRLVIERSGGQNPARIKSHVLDTTRADRYRQRVDIFDRDDDDDSQARRTAAAAAANQMDEADETARAL
jgi:hypothetical protein